MRYYLVTIQYNKVAMAENRTVPKAYDTKDEAIADFHTQMGRDMKNDTLGWAISMVFDNDGMIYKNEKWVAPIVVEEAPTEEEAEVTEEA